MIATKLEGLIHDLLAVLFDHEERLPPEDVASIQQLLRLKPNELESSYSCVQTVSV